MTEEFIADALEKLALVGVMIGFALVVAMYSTWAERKVAAFLQDRIGPNRAGIFGLLQPLADGVKLFSKEEITPKDSNKSEKTGTTFINRIMVTMIATTMTAIGYFTAFLFFLLIFVEKL